MDQVMSFLGSMFEVTGWKVPVAVLAGVWVGDYAGRKFPRAWSWLRAGAKTAGDAAKGAVRE